MSQLQIGWAQRDISTEEPVTIIGQANLRISKGCADKLTLTALSMRDGDTVIFLSIDATQITSTLFLEIKEKIARKDPSVPTDKLIVNATHTHTTGGFFRGCGWFSYEERDEYEDENIDTLPNPLPYYPVEKYRAFVSDMASDAVVEAYRSMTDGQVCYGYGTESIGASRRVVYEDEGYAQMYGDTKKPTFSGFEGGVDPKINLLYTFDMGGKLTGAVINVACPSQVSENDDMLSADYWHETRELIRREHGDIYILPQCAAAGDAAPCSLYYGRAHVRRLFMLHGDAKNPERMEIAEKLRHTFAETLGWAKGEMFTTMPISHRTETIHLSKRLVTDEEKEEYEKKLQTLKETPYITEGMDAEQMWEENTTHIGAIAQCHMILDRYEEDKTTKTFPMEMHTVGMGPIAFCTSCFELYTDYMHRIQARSPFVQTFVLQLCGIPQKNGGNHYLATKRAMEHGGYSAYVFSNIISADGGQELVEKTLTALNDLYPVSNP